MQMQKLMDLKAEMDEFTIRFGNLNIFLSPHLVKEVERKSVRIWNLNKTSNQLELIVFIKQTVQQQNTNSFQVRKEHSTR